MADIALAHAMGHANLPLPMRDTTTVVIHPGLDGVAFALDPSNPQSPPQPPSPSSGWEYMRVWKRQVTSLLVMALMTPPLLLMMTLQLLVEMLISVLLTPLVVLLMLLVELLRPLVDGTVYIWWRISNSRLQHPVEKAGERTACTVSDGSKQTPWRPAPLGDPVNKLSIPTDATFPPNQM